MRAITVRQPWAWAIIHGGKDVENRTTNIAGSYRGPVAIHAGLDPNPGPWWAAIDPPIGSCGGSEFGAILGVVDLVDMHYSTACPTYRRDAQWPLCSQWAERSAFHLVLANPRPLPEPIPYRGRLGLWNLPDDVLPAEVMGR